MTSPTAFATDALTIGKQMGGAMDPPGIETAAFQPFVQQSGTNARRPR